MFSAPQITSSTTIRSTHLFFFICTFPSPPEAVLPAWRALLYQAAPLKRHSFQGEPSHSHTNWSCGSPKLTAMAVSTFSITCSSTWPIRSRSRFLSRVRTCSSRTTESRLRPQF